MSIRNLKELSQADFSKNPTYQVIKILHAQFLQNGMSLDTIELYCLTILQQQKIFIPYPPNDWEQKTSTQEFLDMANNYAKLILNVRLAWAQIVHNPDAYVLANFPELKFYQ